MTLTDRELWALLHGLVFGGIFLIAYTGGIVSIWWLKAGEVSVEGLRRRLLLTQIGTTVMAIVAWLTVISGTFIVYPWYRAAPPEGTTDLTDYPRSYLLDDPNLSGWHSFAMEWKEHIAWFAPILATAVAYLAIRYGAAITESNRLRRIMLITLTISFAAAAIAGVLGALITKAAPVH